MGFSAFAKGIRRIMGDPNQSQQQGQPIMVTEEVQPGPQGPVVPQNEPITDPMSQPAAPVGPAPDPAPAPPVAPKQQKQRVKEDVTEPKDEDRSIYNCPACGGEGLENGTNQYKICPTCNGTGKV